MRISLLLLFVSGFLLAADDPFLPVRPRFSLAFHENGKAAAEQRAAMLNNPSYPLPPQFSCGLSGMVSSEGPRIGGGQLGLKGTYYDSASQSIMHVGGGISLSDSRFSFAGFPPGDYFLLLSVDGKNIYSNRIHLPLDKKEADSFQVIVPKMVEISGSIEGLPVWAMESPLVGSGSSFAQVDRAGKFNFASAVRADDKITVILRFLNKFTTEWDVALYHYKFSFLQEIPARKIIIPEVGSWKSAEGKVSFGNDLPGQALAPVLQNLSIVAVSADGAISYECSPDVQGRFLLIGLPDGDYSVKVDTFGNPPFTSIPIKISVVDHKAPEMAIVLHAIK